MLFSFQTIISNLLPVEGWSQNGGKTDCSSIYVAVAFLEVCVMVHGHVCFCTQSVCDCTWTCVHLHTKCAWLFMGMCAFAKCVCDCAWASVHLHTKCDWLSVGMCAFVHKANWEEMSPCTFEGSLFWIVGYRFKGALFLCRFLFGSFKNWFIRV